MSATIKEQDQPLKGFTLVLATIALGMGTLLISLDQFIANVSIPYIAGDLGVSRDDGTWVITSYVVANATTVPLTGWLTAMFGRVRLFCISAIVFSIISLLCGMAPDFGTLILFRILQGASSGSLIPLSQALLVFLFPKKRGFAMGMWGLVVMVGPALGPVVGGWITYNFNWRWIFLINLPLGILAGVLAYALLSSFESVRKRERIDVIGILLLCGWVGCYQVMLDRGNDEDWFRSNFIVTLAISAVILFCFFLIWELFHPRPVVDLSFFLDRNFTFASLMLGIAVMCIFGGLIVGPIWVQSQLGYTPVWAGYSIAPFGLTGLVIFPLIGIALTWMDARIWVLTGWLIFIPPAFYLAYLPIWTSFSHLAWPRFFEGIAFALFYVPLTTISLSNVAQNKMPMAAGVFSFVRLIFLSTGVSLSTTFFSRRENFFQSRYVEYIIPSNPQYVPYYEKVEQVTGLSGLPREAFVNKMVMDQAYTQTFLELNYLAAWAFIFSLILFLFLRRAKKAKGEVAEMME